MSTGALDDVSQFISGLGGTYVSVKRALAPPVYNPFPGTNATINPKADLARAQMAGIDSNAAPVPAAQSGSPFGAAIAGTVSQISSRSWMIVGACAFVLIALVLLRRR